MSFRYHDDDSTSGSTIATVLLGAVAGFAVGMYVAQRMGGLSGIASRFKQRAAEAAGRPGREFDFVGEEYDEFDDDDEGAERRAATVDRNEDDFNGMDAVEGEAARTSANDGTGDDVPLLEERVLEAFNNDPTLAERAIDIGAMGRGTIELAGWVDSDDEAEHAMTVARGVPGVETVVNRLMVDEEEEQIGDNLRRFRDGDPALHTKRWEGQQVGTGRRRQGSSDEIDRHADPKPELEDRWLSEAEAVRQAADDIDVTRRRSRKKAETQPEA